VWPLNPQEWEQQDGWEASVCEPVAKYSIPPREARFILEVFGQFSRAGIPVYEVLDDMRKVLEERLVS